MKLHAPLALASLIFSGAIFGFYYAWVCSTMWGLDAADPRIAINAMQAMNASVRNGIFAPAFFGTPFVLLLTAVVIWFSPTERTNGNAANWFFAGCLVHLIFGVFLTAGFNIPMNETLAVVVVPDDIETARTIWQDYSPRWQVFNQIRTATSGLALLLAGIGTLKLNR